MALLSALSLARGFAEYMTTTTTDCDKPISIGSSIMSHQAIASDERLIKVFRTDGQSLENYSRYSPGEEVEVQLGNGNAGDQFIFEADNAHFIGGSCGGKRVTHQSKAILKLPLTADRVSPGTEDDAASRSGTVTVRAAWADGYKAVRVAPEFVLTSSTTADTDTVTDGAVGKTIGSTFGDTDSSSGSHSDISVQIESNDRGNHSDIDTTSLVESGTIDAELQQILGAKTEEELAAPH